MPDFYPRRDSALLNWSANFSARIVASPGDYGLTVQDAADFSALQQAYAHWYVKATQPSTRTAVSVRMKDETRAAMMAKGRELAAIVRARSGTTNEQMVLLGLRRRVKARRAVPVPGEAPRVRVGLARFGALPKVKLTDGVTGRARKPAGVSMAVVLYAVGSKAPVSLGDWKFALTTGDPLFRLPGELGLAGYVPEPGERVWLLACWVNDRGERGPWSEPTSWVMLHGLGLHQSTRRRAA
jgi:hypothetical protein